MAYISPKVCCTTLQSPSTKKITSRYIKEDAKKKLRKGTQTMKNLLVFQPMKLIPTFLTNIGSLKQSR